MSALSYELIDPCLQSKEPYEADLLSQAKHGLVLVDDSAPDIQPNRNDAGETHLTAIWRDGPLDEDIVTRLINSLIGPGAKRLRVFPALSTVILVHKDPLTLSAIVDLLTSPSLKEFGWTVCRGW